MSGIELWIGGYLVVGVLVTEFMRFIHDDSKRITFEMWAVWVVLYPLDLLFMFWKRMKKK